MPQQQFLQRLPVLSETRIRRLRLQLPLEVLAVKAGVPSAALSLFERGKRPLSEHQQERLDRTLAQLEAAR